jgi:hypothetical protein
LRSLWQLLHDTNVSTLSADIEFIRRLIEVGISSIWDFHWLNVKNFTSTVAAAH